MIIENGEHETAERSSWPENSSGGTQASYNKRLYITAKNKYAFSNVLTYFL